MKVNKKRRKREGSARLVGVPLTSKDTTAALHVASQGTKRKIKPQ